MFSPRLNTVFASRWKALWWAAGIMTTAYCTVPDRGETIAGEPLEAPAPPPPPHKSPWAK